MKDTRLREIEDHALKVEISRALSLLIYNITLHKIPRLVKCPDTYSTGAPASVSESRSHQPNGDFACDPCIRTDLPLSKALRNRRLANGLWIPQPPTDHSRAACAGVSWCGKGTPWMLCFMKRSFGIFAGLACQRTKCDTHLTTEEAAQLVTAPTCERPANASAIDHRTNRVHIVHKNADGDAWSLHCWRPRCDSASSSKSIRTPTVSCRAEPVPRLQDYPWHYCSE